jgi:hypothetical protein
MDNPSVELRARLDPLVSLEKIVCLKEKEALRETVVPAAAATPSSPTGHLTEQDLELRRQRSRLLEEVNAGITQDDLKYLLYGKYSAQELSEAQTRGATEAMRVHLKRLFLQLTQEQVDRLVCATRAIQDIRQSDYYKGLSKTSRMVVETAPGVIFTRRRSSFWERIFSNESAEATHQLRLDIERNRREIIAVLGPIMRNDLELKNYLAKLFPHVKGTRLPDKFSKRRFWL